MEIFELPDVTISQGERIPTDVRELCDLGWLADARIELLNHEGIPSISEREVVGASPDLGITLVQGFAVPSSNQGALYIEDDNRLYPATWCERRRWASGLHGRRRKPRSDLISPNMLALRYLGLTVEPLCQQF